MEKEFISVDLDMPIANKLCLVKMVIDVNKKQEILKNKKTLISIIENPEPNEIIMQGHFSSYTKDWVVSFKINPKFQKITHWKY